MDISTKIAEILANRKNNIPIIDREINRWENIRSQIDLLNSRLASLKEDDSFSQILSSAQNLSLSSSQDKIPSILANLYSLKERFSRDTINIGVSGQARVGKSTLLQSVSGLGENQIPTGDNLPVTAVKSQIFHSDKNIAHIEFHNFESFKDSILKPYHEKLELRVPESLSAFKDYQYPSNLDKDEPSLITILEKLKQMQSALWSYENLLGRPSENISLDNLKEYVAYPTNAQEADVATCQRKYLAVKDVKIFCQFPYSPVKQLGFIDLPGLGELSASLEEHHLQGVQKGVDFVILVKRPGGTDGFWTAKDGNAIDLLNRAKSFQDRKDFISILINTDKRANSEQLNALKSDIFRALNQGEENKVFKVIEADAFDKEKIGDSLLNPVLTHLANSLGRMDKAIIDGTFDSFKTIENDLKQEIEKFNQSLNHSSVEIGNNREAIEDLAETLLDNVTEGIQDYMENFQPDNDDYSEKYIEIIEDRSNAIEDWIKNGFGRGDANWLEYARKQQRKNIGLAGLAENQCNHIRVEISKQFTELDLFFDEEIQKFLSTIADVFKQHTGQLLTDTDDGYQTLKKLEKLMREAVENGISAPAENLAQSVNQLCGIELDYRKQIHPRVREHLNFLEYQTKDAEGNFVSKINKVSNEEDLLHEIKSLALKAVYETKKALLDDSDFPRQVLFANLEQFEDEIVRSDTSRKEFQRLAFSYTYDLAPDKFAKLEASSKRLNDIRSAVKSIEQSLKETDI